MISEKKNCREKSMLMWRIKGMEMRGDREVMPHVDLNHSCRALSRSSSGACRMKYRNQMPLIHPKTILENNVSAVDAIEDLAVPEVHYMG